MSKAGKRLIESAQQALDFAKGIANTDENRVHIPADTMPSSRRMPRPKVLQLSKAINHSVNKSL